MMLADLIRDDADENNENVPESAPKRRTRMSNESERKRTRFVPSPSLDGARERVRGDGQSIVRSRKTSGSRRGSLLRDAYYSR